MSWKIAFSVALLSALVTAVVTLPIADRMTKLHGVSDFEGARGMLIGFVLLPAGFVGGFLLGLLGTKLASAAEWSQFWKAAGMGVLLGQVALWGIAGLSLLGVPRPVKAHGKQLGLAVEVLVPRNVITTDPRMEGGVRMSLYAGERDNVTLTADTSRFREEEGLLVVPALALLNSRSATRILSFHLGDTWLAFDLPLAPVPTPDSTWSEPAPMRDATTSGMSTKWSDVQLRYRVVALMEAN